MPLCGSTACGCALSTTAATSAAIGGSYPTISADGAGTPASPWELKLDTEWVTKVASGINTVPVSSISVTGQVIGTASNTPITGMSDVYDPKAWGGTTGITPPAGLYAVAAQLDWTSTFAAGVRLIANLYGGVTLIASDERYTVAGTPNACVFTIVELDGTEEVKLEVFQQSGSDKNVDVKLQVARLGDLAGI